MGDRKSEPEIKRKKERETEMSAQETKEDIKDEKGDKELE